MVCIDSVTLFVFGFGVLAELRILQAPMSELQIPKPLRPGNPEASNPATTYRIIEPSSRRLCI